MASEMELHIESIPDTEWIQKEMNLLTMSLESIASSIAPPDGKRHPGLDSAGGYVASATEAVMGLTTAGIKIAESLDGIADAIRER